MSANDKPNHDRRAQGGSFVYNLNTCVAPHDAASVFISDINKKINDGYGFVPLIGAGFSAPSGIPLVRQLRSYLQRGICMALGAEEDGMRPWNPREDQWPPFVDRTRPEPVDWQGAVYAAYVNRAQQGKPDSELAVFQEGYGAMAEWRSSLLFLSRLVRTPDDAGAMKRGRLTLGAPQQEVIDSCFREVMRGKAPALSHLMLGALSGLLRLDLILTTNFDNLLELAFNMTRNPLDVFDVHLGGSLPEVSAVSRVRALLKLHGGRYSLRADYSLDGLPPLDDQRRFVEYLATRIPAASSSSGECKCRNHLLVLGVSGAEPRTKAFIRYAWEQIPDLEVYWVCYSERDVKTIQDFTRESVEQKSLRKDNPASYILRHTELGLLLLQLYQTVRRNLPPMGTIFPSVARLALPPMLPKPLPQGVGSSFDSETEWQTFCDEIRSRLASLGHHPPEKDFDCHMSAVRLALRQVLPQPSPRGEGTPFDTENDWQTFCEEIKTRLDSFGDLRAQQDFDRYKVVVATSDPGVHGVTSACSRVFSDLQADNVCLWIDMNDISSTDNLFEVLLEAAYIRLGMEHWTPVYMARDARPRAQEIKRLADSGNLPWILFLNARETPGANAGKPKHMKMLNGWLDDDGVESEGKGWGDQSDRMAPFLDLIKELSGAQSGRISVVLSCYG